VGEDDEAVRRDGEDAQARCRPMRGAAVVARAHGGGGAEQRRRASERASQGGRSKRAGGDPARAVDWTSSSSRWLPRGLARSQAMLAARREALRESGSGAASSAANQGRGRRRRRRPLSRAPPRTTSPLPRSTTALQLSHLLAPGPYRQRTARPSLRRTPTGPRSSPHRSSLDSPHHLDLARRQQGKAAPQHAQPVRQVCPRLSLSPRRHSRPPPWPRRPRSGRSRSAIDSNRGGTRAQS